MSIVRDATHFMENYRSGYDIVLDKDITIADALPATGDLNILGNGHKLTLQKPINIASVNLKFIDMELAITSDDVGAIYTESGSQIVFEDCKISATKVLVGLLSGTKAKTNYSFKNCTITAGGSLIAVAESDITDVAVNKLDPGIYKSINTYVDRSTIGFVDCDITSGATDSVINLDKFIFPIIVGMGAVEEHSLTASSANSLINIGSSGHTIMLTNYKIPAGMTGESGKAVVTFEKDFVGISNDQSVIQLINLDEPKGLKQYAIASDISSDGRPNGYTLYKEEKAIQNGILFEIEGKSGITHQTYLDRIMRTKGKVVYTAVETEDALAENLSVYGVKDLTIKGTINAKSFHAISSYIKVDGTITLDDVFSADANCLVEGSGSITANGTKLTLPIKSGVDSRDKAGPILGATGSAGDGPFTNQVMQSMITKFGNRIFLIKFDNGMGIEVGYQRSAAQTINDILLENIGGVDMIGVRSRMPDPTKMRHTRQNTGVSFVTWHVTACIQAVAIMDEGYEVYRPDPMLVM